MERAHISDLQPSPLAGEGGERSEPGEGSVLGGMARAMPFRWPDEPNKVVLVQVLGAEKLVRDFLNVPMLAIHRIIHPAHILIGDSARELLQGRTHGRMAS